MKYFFMIAIMVAMPVLYAADLLEAMAIVESNRNDRAIGDSGKAIGRYQLHKIYVDDVNRIFKTAFAYEDRTDPQKSKEMVVLYLRHYCKRYERTTGGKATDEVKARIHNGGPNGWNKESTLKYWIKVKKVMENQK